MADEIDFDAFMPKAPTPIAPLPSIAPAPVAALPGDDIDFDAFMPTAPQAPGLAPAPAPRQIPNPVMPRTGSPVVNADFDSVVAKTPGIKNDPALAGAVYKQSEARTLDFAIKTGQYDKVKQIVNLGVDKDAARMAIGALLTGHPGQLASIEEGGGLTRQDLAKLFAGVDSDSTGRLDAILNQARGANPGNHTAGMAVYDILRQQHGMPSIDEANAAATSPEALVGEDRNNIGSQFASNLTANLALPGNMVGASALALGGQGNYFPEAASEVDKYRMPAPDGSAKGTAAALAGAIGGLAGDAPTMILGGRAGRVATKLGAGERLATGVSAGAGSIPHGMDTYGTTLNQGGSQMDALTRGAISVGAEAVSEGMFGVKGSMRLAMPGVSPAKRGMGEMLKDYAADAGSEVVSNQLDTNANSLYDAASTGKRITPWEFQTVHDPKAAVDSMIAGLVGAPMAAGAHAMDQTANPPEPKFQYRFPMGMVHPDDAKDFDASMASDRAAIAAERAAMTPEERHAQDTNEASFDALKPSDMETEVPDAVEALANNAPAPNDGGTQDYLHFFGKPDTSQQETRNGLAPVDPGHQELANKETRVFTPEDLARQEPKPLVSPEPIADPKTAETKLDLAPAVQPSALDTANQYIDTVVAPEARSQARKALVGWDHKADPEGYKDNIAQLVMFKYPAEGKRLAEVNKAERRAPEAAKVPSQKPLDQSDIDTLIAQVRGDPAKSKVVGYDARGNIDTGVPVKPEPVAKNTVAPKAPVAPAPGPIQAPIDFNTKQGEYVSPPASTDAPAIRKQLARGARKGPALVEQHLGKPGFPEKALGDYVTRHVRLFADAGEHLMSVQAKGLGGYHIAWDPARRKAVMTAKTDTKGRKAKNGTELRPVDANGNVQTLDSGKVTLYSSVDAAMKAMTPLTKAAEPGANVAVQGYEPVAAKAPDGQDPRARVLGKGVVSESKEAGADDDATPLPPNTPEVLDAGSKLRAAETELKALDRKSRGMEAGPELDALLERTDALEAEIKDLKATIATKTAEASASEKAKENSPLTPKMRMGLAKVLGADKVKTMTPREVGEVVRKTLHLANDMQPTQDEVGRAIRDLEADGVLAKGQAVIPGDGKVLGVNGGNLFSDPHEAKIVGIAQQALGITKARVLENAISDVPFSQSAQVETINGPKPTRLGHLTSTMVHHVARAINATGYDGAKFERWVARLHLQNVADWVARLHEPFRPVLQAVREQMDETKKERFEAYHRLDRLAGLKGQSRVRANMALVQFRLEDRQRADYGNPLTHTDSRGLVHTFTLTEKERKAVASVYRANRKLLRDQVNAILDILRLPRNLTHKDLVTGLANGSIKPSAQLVEDVLRVLETGSESYVPFMRTGPHVIRVYDQAAYNAAKNAQERKDAIRSTSNAGTLQQARKIISDATDKYPTAHITYQPADAMLAGEEMPGITEKAIIELAEEAGVAYGVMHQFLAGGISDYFATKGARARFKGASKLPGYDTDMYKVNVAHAMQMTNSTMALKYGKILENAVAKKAIPDNRLREYAKMFVNSMSAPASPLGGSVKSAITLWYLGFNAASAAINGTSAYIKGVLLPTLLGVNPAHLVTAPVEATKQMTRALAATLGRGHLGKLSGKNQVQLAIDGWKKTNPGLSDALRDADHAGHLQGKYDIDADDVAKYGEARFKGKAKRAVFDVAMHGFSSVERANRLASSVIGYQLWESMQKAGPIRKKAFDIMTRELNMDTSSAAKFMVSYSNFINFRNDKTESPAIARGNFDAKGQFHNSMLNQGIYALKNYAVNETVSAVSIARAAWKAGAIPRATFLALTAGAIMSFGALTTVVGGPAAATAYKELNGKLHTLEYTAKHSGPVARTLTTGGAGLIAEKIGGQQVGDYIDLVVKRSNNAEAIPSSLSPANVIAGWGMLSSMGDAYNDVVSGNPERVPRGAARLAGKGPSKIVEWGQAWANGGDKLSNTGAPLVAGPAHALPGDPVLNTMDYVAGMAGLTPPIVSKVYEKADMEDTMKKSNDKELEYVIQGLVKSYEIKDPEARKASVSEFTDRIKDWNKAAVEIERYDMYITDEILETSLRLAFEARQKGAFNLKKTPVLGRGEMIKFLKDIPESNRQPEKAKE